MILAPFKWIVALFFNWSQTLFNDPGWAVVGMSVLLSLLLTPLYVWIERRKNSDKAKSAPMQAEIDKIEAVYKGRERYYYTREIQRRYRYSPWTAMIPTLGLLVQIPFLLAAYHYLSELPLFNGVSFWYIKDLSKPDTIAVVAGLPINLLAILMTVINLVSGWRYAESGKPKERIQYMSVAAVFLFLLYNCAASVVLYWTLSNALSFVRSEIFFRKKGQQPVRLDIDETVGRVASWTRVAVRLLFLLAGVLYIDAAFYPDADQVSGYCNVNVLHGFVETSIFIAAAAMVTLAILRRRLGEPFPLGFCVLMVAAVGLLAVPAANRFLDFPVDDVKALGYLAEMGIPLATVVLVALIGASWANFFCAHSDQKSDHCVRDCATGLLCGLCLALQVFVCGPICAYASFPDGAAEVSLLGLWMGGFGRMLCLLLCLYAFLRFAKAAWSEFLTLGCLLVAIAAFAYGNLIPSDYGVLFNGSYGKAANLVPTAAELIGEAFFLVGLVAVLGGCRRLIAQNVSIVRLALGIIAVTFLLRTFYALARMPPRTQAEKVEMRQQEKKLFRFARDKKNVIFIVLDNVLGQRIGTILDNDPGLKAKFAGFTWYPNTISASTFTFPDMPALWAGEEYFPYNLGNGRKLGEVFPCAWNAYQDRILTSGYRLSTSIMALGLGCQVSGAEATFGEMRYNEKRRKCAESESVNSMSLRGNAVLRALPFVFRSKIYNDGKWSGGGGEARNPLLNAYDFLADLSANSVVVSEDKGLYVHIHSEATHFPFSTMKNGALVQEGIDECFKWSLLRVADWLTWMRENGLYDNCRIVICSDHGIGEDQAVGAGLDLRYVKNIDKMRRAAGGATPFFSLLMVKDFRSRDAFKVDQQTKTLSHAAYFAFSDERFSKPVKSITPSSVKNPYPVDWKERFGFEPTSSFRITGDASNGENWHRIEE